MACLKRLILTTFLSHLAIPVPLPPAVQALLGRSRTPFDSPGLDTQAGFIALWLGAHGTGADTSRPESEADRLAAPPEDPCRVYKGWGGENHGSFKALAHAQREGGGGAERAARARRPCAVTRRGVSRGCGQGPPRPS